MPRGRGIFLSIHGAISLVRERVTRLWPKLGIRREMKRGVRCLTRELGCPINLETGMSRSGWFMKRALRRGGGCLRTFCYVAFIDVYLVRGATSRPCSWYGWLNTSKSLCTAAWSRRWRLVSVLTLPVLSIGGGCVLSLQYPSSRRSCWIGVLW